jgi:hypothetical protein
VPPFFGLDRGSCPLPPVRSPKSAIVINRVRGLLRCLRPGTSQTELEVWTPTEASAALPNRNRMRSSESVSNHIQSRCRAAPDTTEALQ